MIQAQHHRLYIWFFRNYFGLLAFVHFRKTSLVRPVAIPENSSVLLLQNHFSWWDGYWSYLLCRNVFHRKFHVMMLEEQLRKHTFLNKCGVFSIQKKNRNSLKSIQYASGLLADPKNLVAIYPAGELLTQHQQTVHFQKGIERILSTENAVFDIVLVVILVDYFGFARPEIRIYLDNYSGVRTVDELEKAYHLFYQSCIANQSE